MLLVWGLLVGAVVGTLAGLTARRASLVKRYELERRLLATLMHDLRTPLTSLQLTLGELSHHEGYSEDELLTLQRAIDEVVGVRSLLENLRLVDAAIVGSPDRAELTEVALHQQLERLPARYEVVARARKTAIRITTAPLQVRADPRLVELLLANLVEVGLRSSSTQIVLSLEPREASFELRCHVPGARVPALTTLEDFASRRERSDRLTTSMGLALVASQLVCATLGWSLTRPSDDAFVIRGASA